MSGETQKEVRDSGEVTLGLTLMGHDVSYTILDGAGVPVLIAEEERYSRRKKGTFIPSPRQITDVLDESGVTAGQVRHLAISGIPDLMERRDLLSRKGNPPFGQSRCTQALLRASICQFGELESVVWVKHHLCHAASAFLPSAHESAAVVTVDGMGEDETATIWHGRGTSLKKLASIAHPHSLGYVYQAISQWSGLTGGEREGKLMGLAALGEPVFLPILREHFLSTRPDGTFALAPALAGLRCDNATWVRHCECYLGPRRRSDEEITTRHQNVAASVQALVEEALLEFVRYAARLTSERHCCLAGGVFMNSMANGRLRREGPFQDLWVQPMASDNGLSLGAALWGFAQRHPTRGKTWRMKTAFLGSDLAAPEIERILAKHSPAARRPERLDLEVASLLAEGKLVGWVQGRSEVGARALGHRSILADPRDPSAKDRLNSRIKQREAWRPFAPTVLEEDAHRFFTDPRPSPMMMFVSPAVPDAPIPAALHVDHTARVQTVSADDNAALWRLLRAFRDLTGVGALLNTSFNVRGGPIVRTAGEAYRIFAGTGMDVLVLGEYLLEKRPGTNHEFPLVKAERPRTIIPATLASLGSGVKSCIVVSLGRGQLREAALHTLRDRCPTVIPLERPPVGALGYPFELKELRDARGGRVLVTELPDADLVVVLLPVWAEIAAEVVPNLLDPFLALAVSDKRRVVFVDEAGASLNADALFESWRRSGSRGCVSEVEHFWITREAEN